MKRRRCYLPSLLGMSWRRFQPPSSATGSVQSGSCHALSCCGALNERLLLCCAYCYYLLHLNVRHAHRIDSESRGGCCSGDCQIYYLQTNLTCCTICQHTQPKNSIQGQPSPSSHLSWLHIQSRSRYRWLLRAGGCWV